MTSVRKIAVTVAGLVVVAVGVALLVLPGPGLIVVVLGLALLATEYEWARRWLQTTRVKAQQASDASVSNTWSTLATVLFGLLMIATGVLMVVGVELVLLGHTASDLPGWSAVTGGVIIGTAVLLLASTAYSYRDAHKRADTDHCDLETAAHHVRDERDDFLQPPYGPDGR